MSGTSTSSDGRLCCSTPVRPRSRRRRRRRRPRRSSAPSCIADTCRVPPPSCGCFFVRLRMLSSAALPATAHTVLSDRLSVPVISDALSERMSSASRTVRYGPATSASPSWVPSMEKESTTMSTVPSVSAEARMAGDSCFEHDLLSAYPRVSPRILATSMSKPEYSPPCRYPSPGWSAATPIAIVGPCAALRPPRKPMCRTRRRGRK